MGATTTSAPRTKSADVLITEAVRLAKPVDTLTRLAEARKALGATSERLHSATHHAIVAARSTEPPATWPEIGSILGVSAQRAQQLARPQ
jgi:hypothetical protein